MKLLRLMQIYKERQLLRKEADIVDTVITIFQASLLTIIYFSFIIKIFSTFENALRFF